MRDNYRVGRVVILGLVMAQVFVLLALPVPMAAQEGVNVTPKSGRYQLTLPEGWVADTQEIRGLEGIFLNEIVAMGDSTEALVGLADLDPTKPKTGNTLIANIFPTALAWRGIVTDDPQVIFSNILGPSIENAEFLEIDGLPAIRTRDYFGPPYPNAEFAGQTMILDGALIYYLIYSGDTETDMTTLETIALSFQRAEINSIDSTVTPEMNTLDGPTLRTSDTYFQMALGAGWIVSQASTAPSEAFLVLPDTSLLPFVFGGQFADTLPGLFIQVVVQPYDLLFGSADTQITADDRAFVMDQAIGSLGGVPDGAVIESTAENLTRLEVRVNNAFGGDNRGYILIIDANQTMYSVSFVGAAANWEEDYQPLVTALIDSIQIATAPPTAANPNSLVVGIQRGQLAPDFTVTLVDGSTLSLSDLRGQIVLLNFWATWCVPCRAEMPEFQQAFEANQDQGFTVLAVNLLETPTQIQAFADELGLSFPLALDPNGEINSLYRVAGYPSTYIIDRQGVILAVNIGPVTATQVQEWVRLAQE